MVVSIVILLGILALLSTVDATQRGLGWATNNDYASDFANKSLVPWYYHWQDGPVPQMPSAIEYVYMFWGPSKMDDWNDRLAEMQKNTPAYLLAFNEPDISSQANMDPSSAAQLYMDQINPWASKGTKLGSPAIAYSIDWLSSFLSEVDKKGGQVDFVCAHWYGSWDDIEAFKSYVQTVHSTSNKTVWVTELGITTASNPTQSQTQNFMISAFNWMDSQSYVERAAWFGAFESDSPPDGFASSENALFQPGGQLSDMGSWYTTTPSPGNSQQSRSITGRRLYLRDIK